LQEIEAVVRPIQELNGERYTEQGLLLNKNTRWTRHHTDDTSTQGRMAEFSVSKEISATGEDDMSARLTSPGNMLLLPRYHVGRKFLRMHM